MLSEYAICSITFNTSIICEFKFLIPVVINKTIFTNCNTKTKSTKHSGRGSILRHHKSPIEVDSSFPFMGRAVGH